MPKAALNSWINQRFKKTPLKTIFIVSTLLQVVTAVGLTGYFSFRNGQDAVNDVATELRDEITERVKERLLLYVETPHLINQLNINAIQLGHLTAQSVEYQERYFWHQIRTFPLITYNFYGSANGNYLGARRRPDGSLHVIRRDAKTGINQYYATDNQGNRTRLVQSAANFDPRQRPWYKKAIVVGDRPSWSEIYPDFSTKGLAITAVRSVYDTQGKLQGVLGSDFIFSEVNEFLRSIKVGQSGQIFIMERSGLLVASSTLFPIYRKVGDQTQRVKAADSPILLIRQTTLDLENHFGDLHQIQRSHLLDLNLQGGRRFVQVTPLQDGRGLDWLIVVVIPEADFMGHIQRNTYITLFLCFLSLIVATAVGLQTSRWIARPILRLNTAAKQLAKGHWEQEVPIVRSDEIGELAQSFTSMTKQLREAFETLEQKVQDRTKELAEVNEDLEQRNALIRKIFGRYLSDEIVANLLESPAALALGGERRVITILTSDLRGFTATSERLSPEEVIKVLNFYLENMADVITRYEGTIDEFMGDGILALFGAPTVRVDDAQRAVACAIAMQQAMQVVNQQLQDWGFPPLEMGIGIHTGEVIVGNIGSEKRSKYGVVGSNVNLTYRIEACTIGGQILISEATLREVSDIACIEQHQEVQMKGVKDPISMYEVSGIAGDYNLFLLKEKEELLHLSQAVRVQYVALEGKQIDDRWCVGQLTHLSSRQALISSNEVRSPKSLTNLKLVFVSPTDSDGVSEDFYAKVLDKPAQNGSFYIHFTSIPTSVRKILNQLHTVKASASVIEFIKN